MIKFWWLIAVICMGGCAVATVSTTPETTVAPSRSVQYNFPSDDAIKKLLLGVSREEALALIGRTATVGYELRPGTKDEYQAVTVSNPHRSQQITRGSRVYQVDYYLTHINKADGVVSEDELTPLVFESSQLVGKGWDFLKEKIKH